MKFQEEENVEKNHPEGGDALMTMAEVAVVWRCSVDTVRRRIRAGSLPTVPVGTGIRIRREDALKGAS